MKIATIIFGVLLVISGIYCMFAPVATYAALGSVIGVSMLVEGVASVIAWNHLRKAGLANGWALAEAIISIVLGIVLLGSTAMQFAIDMFIAYLIAVWLVFAGIARIVAAIALRNSLGKELGRGWILQLVLGVLIVICGVLSIFNPLSVMASVGLMLGMSIVFVGAGLIASGTEM